MTAKARAGAQDKDRVAEDAAAELREWAELGQLLDGLSHANAALKAAAQGVIRQYDLGPRGAWMLSMIASGVRLPMDLATAFKTSRSLITIELNRVIKAGLVETSPSLVDGRRTELALTPLGAAACRSLRKETARIIRRNLAGYSDEQIQFFAQALKDVRRVEPDDGSPPATLS
ncbi:MarR family winged helix-turn-helix transcriptional regulator [Caulobacter soli]|uniref:MarR family winged helix-turn-helix transcriptional regulator n=1 Tax=Caulobacter soli TaxID=2708539 RepID=UPI0013ECEBFB|nr:hypothetical protein [Caulobacter soli]